MAKKILVVTKDNGEFNVYEPVVRLLESRGIECTIVAEGLSLPKWRDAGYATEDFNPARSVEEVKAYLSFFDALGGGTAGSLAVMTGLGAPINLGEKFGLAANQLHIPVGYVHDLWGVFKRSSAIPDFVCVTDTYDETLVNQHPPYQNRPHVYVTGSPAMDSLTRVESNHWLNLMLDSTNWPNGLETVLVLGQDESTTPMLEGLIASLDTWAEESAGDYVLIPRLHPKFMNNDELWHRWLSLLYGAKKGKVLFVENEVSTRQLMKSAQFTVSVYSTGLIEAAMLGSIAVSWISDIGLQKMRTSLGVGQFPLVEMSCAQEVTTREDFRRLLGFSRQDRSNLCRNAQQALKCDGRNTERVVQAILTELQ